MGPIRQILPASDGKSRTPQSLPAQTYHLSHQGGTLIAMAIIPFLSHSGEMSFHRCLGQWQSEGEPVEVEFASPTGLTLMNTTGILTDLEVCDTEEDGTELTFWLDKTELGFNERECTIELLKPNESLQVTVRNKEYEIVSIITFTIRRTKNIFPMERILSEEIRNKLSF